MAHCMHCLSCLSHCTVDNVMSTKINASKMFDESEYLNGLFIGWIFVSAFLILLMFSKFEDDLQVRAQQEEAILASECKALERVSKTDSRYICIDGTTKIRRTL
jgi:hypothetical protein